MKSSQLLRMLCGYYSITEEQLVFWLHQKASHPDSPLKLSIEVEKTYIDESIIFMILNDVIISVIAEGNNE